MHKDQTGDQHLRLFFKPRAAVAVDSTVTVSVVATPNASCTDPRTPAPLTLVWNLTLADPAPWTDQGRDDQVSSGPFSPLRRAADATGLVFPPKLDRLPPHRRRARQRRAELRRAQALRRQRGRGRHVAERHHHA